MIDSILPALGLRPTLRIVYVAPLSAGSIDSTASRILALRAARPSHRVPRISIRSLQLTQAFGLPTAPS